MQKDLLLEENYSMNVIRSNTPTPNFSNPHLMRTVAENSVQQRCQNVECNKLMLF